MTASRRADVVVVGLGAMGSAVCAQLAARGASVIGIDQYDVPHPYGSTHGETRMTRLAVGEGPEYVPLVRRSHELWREIEAQTGTPLMTQTGGLIMSRPGSWFYERTRALARRLEIEHEELSPTELHERFPMFVVDEETEGYFEPAAGFVRPEQAVRAQLELARRGGAELRPGERVLDWSASGRGVSVVTDHATYASEELIVVLIVSPCSGHGFKHSPAIGEAVAQWVTEGSPDLDLGHFRLPHPVG